jgi:hypothetical protein
VGAYDLGVGWRAGARFFFYTGRPYTSNTAGTYFLYPINSNRLPPFARLDLRLEKRWRIGETSYLALVFEGLNVTLQKEPFDVQSICKYTASSGGASLTCHDEVRQLGPISIPSVGIEGAF